jgi:hypothetical protein
MRMPETTLEWLVAALLVAVVFLIVIVLRLMRKLEGQAQTQQLPGAASELPLPSTPTSASPNRQTLLNLLFWATLFVLGMVIWNLAGSAQGR